MTYGDYNGPDKADKGKENGSCNRTQCQAPDAKYYNHGSLSWYCADCARDIGQDRINLQNWNLNYKPQCGHGMFQSRDEMTEFESKLSGIFPNICILDDVPSKDISFFDLDLGKLEKHLNTGFDWGIEPHMKEAINRNVRGHNKPALQNQHMYEYWRNGSTLELKIWDMSPVYLEQAFKHSWQMEPIEHEEKDWKRKVYKSGPETPPEASKRKKLRAKRKKRK